MDSRTRLNLTGIVCGGLLFGTIGYVLGRAEGRQEMTPKKAFVHTPSSGIDEKGSYYRLDGRAIMGLETEDRTIIYFKIANDEIPDTFVPFGKPIKYNPSVPEYGNK